MIRGITLFLFAGPVLALAAEPPKPAPPAGRTPVASRAPDTRRLVDTLDQSALQEAFRLLTNDYIQHNDLDPLEVNRAALQGLLNRLEFGAMLLTERTLAERNSPFAFHHTRLGEEIGYVRFGRYGEDELEKFDTALREFNEAKAVEHLLLDLRSPQAQAEFSIAARILGRFRPPNELLFKIRRPGNERSTLFVSEPEATGWRKEVILLVDGETGNVGEIIAAVLKRETGCLVLGGPTPGLAVEYRDVPIGEDRILRYAIAEVVLEDNSSIFQSGVTPDVQTVTAVRTKHDIFRAVDGGKPLADYLFQKQRPRMNEAALVAGTDPEIDYYLLLSQDKPTPWDRPPLQDRTLQQTVDLLQTTRFLESKAQSRR